jgi:hypothetical protein
VRRRTVDVTAAAAASTTNGAVAEMVRDGDGVEPLPLGRPRSGEQRRAVRPARERHPEPQICHVASSLTLVDAVTSQARSHGASCRPSGARVEPREEEIV